MAAHNEDEYEDFVQNGGEGERRGWNTFLFALTRFAPRSVASAPTKAELSKGLTYFGALRGGEELLVCEEAPGGSTGGSRRFYGTNT